ncbi:centrosomal protein of 85 kDa-like isoform X12 [Bolinopsis microptera]|uniref:centrosomal protein of 85 kDa-like isoform X12 n=1 Tax=Bolinopsis microptera TaxID=2820187 RepID=UPI00307A814D
MRHVDSSISEPQLCTNEPYLNVCSYDSRHPTSTSSSRVTSPQPLDSPNPRDQLSNPRDQLSNPRDRVQKNSFESGYSSSSGSSNSCNSRRGGYGIVRRRTIGGGERERDRCSTPVASPPPGDGGLDQFVKTRERAESVGRSGEGQNGDVRKWGSCSRLEYNGQPGYGHYPVPGHERTEGDGGPASYPEPYNNQYTEPAYNPYNRRHSSSKMSSHSNNSDEVILAQKAELEEKNRVIESLKMRMTDGDSKLTERAYSDKSGEHGAVAESLDSGIDIRSETGVMKPLFGGQRTSSDERNELAKLRLYVKQLEAKVDSGVSSSYEEESKVENLLKDNQKLIDEKTSISRKFARLQDYLTTLPTVNEYTKLQEQLTQLTEENTNLQEEQKRVTESSKDVKLKDADMKKYQKKCTDMRESIMKLEKQNNLLKSQNANQAKQELQKVELEKSKMEKKMEQLKKEISVLSEQKESTKSLVGGYYEKFNNEQEKTKILTQSLENSVNEVEDLRSELDRRIHQEEELQGRISDLERELEAVLLKMEEYESQENRDVENSELLMAEYNAAFQDLNSVVEVCQMRVQGQQLDISLLLGLGASPRPSNKEDLTVESQLRNIQALRSNIENIRTLLSDLYAEDIGSQCPTQ